MRIGFDIILLLTFFSIVFLIHKFVNHCTIAKSFKWLLKDFSGFSYLFDMIFSPNKEIKHTSFLLWFIGIYIAIFGYALQRYETQLATIENRLEVITTQVSAGNLPALNRIPEIQNSACCQRPTISSPASVFSSLLISVKFKTINTVPKDLISDCMDSLSNLNLRNVDVSGLNLTGIGLHQTNLTGADCRGTNFSGKEIRYCYPPAPSWLHHVCFDSADARNADFAWAILDGVSFENSNLQHANFWNAWLRCWWILSEHVSFKGADLSYANFEHAKNIDWREIGKAKTLYNAKFDPFIDSILHKNCSQLFEKKRDKRTICTCDTVQIFVSDSLKFQYFNVDTESIGCPLCSDQAEGDTVPSMDFKQCW